VELHARVRRAAIVDGEAIGPFWVILLMDADRFTPSRSATDWRKC
jgi:hypothetical protein